jgi:hypothetical protein
MATKMLTGVWRPSNGAQHWHTGLTFAEFKAMDADMLAKGMRLVDMCGEHDENDFTGVWRSGSGAQHSSAKVCVSPL